MTRHARPFLLLLPLLNLALGLAAAPLEAQAGPRPGEVTLSLADYLALVERVEKVEQERARRTAQQEAPLAEVVAQQTAVTLGDGQAELVSRFEVLIQGSLKQPAPLPLAGYPRRSAVRRDGKPDPAAAVSAGPSAGQVLLVAPAPGRYEVEIASVAVLENRGGSNRLTLAPAAAPVAVTEIDLPADLAWSAPGTVIVEDAVQGARRKVRLTSRRGESRAFEVRRKVDGSAASELLAQNVVLTLFQLRPDGLRRHDVVLYEVSRGSLGSFTVDLPLGLDVERVSTDEGEVLPSVETRRLTVQRRRQLQGTGYLVLTSTPAPESLAAGVPLAAAKPGVEVRARYLAASSSVAADLRPVPETAWMRVDLDDLPQALGSALAALELSSAWRLAPAAADGAATSLAVSILPAAPELETAVRQRETTTLVTVDGTVVHRDRFTLDPPPPAGAAFDVVLPAGASLWSASVGNLPVRPLERGGRVTVPLGFGGKEGEPAEIEVVSVLERAVPAGRSRLALELAQVQLPVLDHRWRLLLPEGARYRFRGGDLRPARPWNVGGRAASAPSDLRPVLAPAPPPPPPPASEPEAIAVTAEQGVTDEIRVQGKPSRDERKEQERLRKDKDANAELDDLRQGLVGGVKPLPVEIPEEGKLLLLGGVLPPARVAVELEVRKGR